MKLKERLQIVFQGKMNDKQLERLPAGYAVIGDIAIFHHIDESIRDYKGLLGEVILEIDPKIKVVVEQLGVSEDQVTPEASFVDDLGADSLDTVELVMALEEEFDAEIPDDQAESITKVKDAVAYITEHAS